MDFGELLKKKSTWAGLVLIATAALPAFGVSVKVIAGVEAVLLGLSIIFLRHGILKAEGKNALLLFICLAMLTCGTGCNRGDLQFSPVIAGEPAPHAGYNIGPQLWLEPGDDVLVSGAVIRITGLDPNDLIGE